MNWQKAIFGETKKQAQVRGAVQAESETDKLRRTLQEERDALMREVIERAKGDE